MEFSKHFDSYMTSQGITNYQMSKDTGISDSLIGYWRSGKRKPSLDNLIVISNYLKVSLDFLVHGSEYANISTLLDSGKLSDSEQELLSTYQQLDRRGQHRVHTIIYEELDRMNAEVAGEISVSKSIYKTS